MTVPHIDLGKFPEERGSLAAGDQERNGGITQVHNVVIFYFTKFRNEFQFFPERGLLVVDHDLMDIGASLKNALRTRPYHRRDPRLGIFPGKRHDHRRRQDHIPEIAQCYDKDIHGFLKIFSTASKTSSGVMRESQPSAGRFLPKKGMV